MLAPTSLRPRSARPATATTPTTTIRRPLQRYLAGGGLLGAIGDAFYQYVPPLHVPVANVQQAAPVDVSAAWDAADKTGTEAGGKALEAAKTQLKETFSKMKIAPAYAAEMRDRHMDFITGEQQRLAADPAAYNSRSVQLEVEKRAAQLLDPNGSRLMANANEYEQKLKEQTALDQKGQLDYVALNEQGEPLDYTYRHFYNDYTTEENPEVLRRYLPMRSDGRGNELGSAPLTHQMPQLSHEQSQAELEKIYGSINLDVTEWSNTGFSEQVPASMQQLYQQLGGDAWGVMSTTNKHRRENNLTNIKRLVDMVRGTGDYAKAGSQLEKILSPAALQQLTAEQYQRIAAQPDEQIGKALGLPDNAIKLSTDESLPLGNTHLQTRQRLRDVLLAGRTSKGPLSDADRQQLYGYYATLRRADLLAAQRAVGDNMLQRAGLMQFVRKSDLEDKSLQLGGQKPDASASSDKADLYTDIMHAANMDFVSPSTQYEDGVDEHGKPVMRNGIGFWSANLSTSPAFKELENNLVRKDTPTGGTTNKSLADLSSSGVIYNAHTLGVVSTGTTSDPTLANIRVVPGPGQVVYLPTDPALLRMKRAEIKQDEAELNATRDKLNAYMARKQKGEKFSEAEMKQIQLLGAREKQLTDKATQNGMAPFVRLSAVTRNANLADSKAYKQSVGDRFNTDRMLGRGFLYSKAFNGLFQNNHGFDKSLTGITGLSSSEAEQYGLEDEVGIDDLVKFDVFVQLPNPHLSGNRESQISNSATYTKVQQAQVRQGMSNVAAKGQQHL